MPFNIFNKRKASVPNKQPPNSQPEDGDDIKFKALKVTIHGEIDYNIVQISYRHTTHHQDGNEYLVPKPFEPSRPENKGVPLRMFVLDLKDEMFSGHSSEWRGRYSVWYRSDLRGCFYLVKQWNPEYMSGALIHYVDIPEPKGKNFWFLSEMSDIRKTILARK